MDTTAGVRCDFGTGEWMKVDRQETENGTRIILICFFVYKIVFFRNKGRTYRIYIIK